MATFRGMDVAMTLNGVTEAERKIGRIQAAVTGESANAVRAACVRITTIARQFAPVRTGRLRNAITYRLRGTFGTVGVRGTTGPAIYWRFVEFGTVRSAARPFFRPAAESGKTPYINDMRMMGAKIQRVA